MADGIKAPIGAGNLLTIHPILTGAFQAATFTFDKNVTMDYVGHPLKQSLVITLDNKIDNEAFNTFLKSYLTNANVEESKVEYVDATEDTITSGLSTAKPFGYIWYGGIDADTKRKVIYGKGVLSGDSGNASYQGKGIGNYPIQITTVKGETLTVASALFNTGKVTMATGVTLASTEYGTIIFATAAAV